MADYEDQLAWLYQRQSLGIHLGLDKVRALLHRLGDPQTTFHSIHVAGTNGKGSVSRMLAATLSRHGIKTGCTTSPHLVSFTERIEIDGRPLARHTIARLLRMLRPHVESLGEQGLTLTFFEIVTALAFLAFREEGVEWAVVETGMGGRLDATNVLDPVLTVITNVSLDHQRHLGTTTAAIALEKAGIMKPGVPCVTAATGEALRVLKGHSHAVQAPMSVIGEDYHIGPSRDGLDLIRPTGESHLALGLKGAHQEENVALVVAAVDALRRCGLEVAERALQDALLQTVHPGRLQEFTVSDQFQVVVDGAHNVAAAEALSRHVKTHDWTVDLVVGFCADKDWQARLAAWLPHAQHVWAVPVRNPRSLEPRLIVEHSRLLGVPATSSQGVQAALDAARRRGARRVLVAGSLFLAGEAVAVLTGAGLEEIHGSQ